MLSAKLRAFPSRNEGNVAIIFAVALPVIVGTVGGGIDLARASKMRSALTQAVDSAATRLEETRISCPRGAGTQSTDVSDCTTGDGEKLRSYAARLITQEFQNAGFDTKVEVGPRVMLNPANHRFILSATSSYSCTLVKLLSSTCDINVGSRSHAPQSVSQADGALSLSVPNQAEIWLGEYGSPALPTRVAANGGRKPYQFAIGPNLPEGLHLDAKSGSISGLPKAVECELDCKPQVRRISVSAFDSSSPNRMAASGVITYLVVHPLNVELKQTRHGNSVSIETVLTGGKPPFSFMCAGTVPNATCDSGSGKILRTGPGGAGELTVTVTDARGKSASAKANIQP